MGSNINNTGGFDSSGNAIAIGNTVANSVYLGSSTVATTGNTVGTQLLRSNGQQGITTTAGNTGTVTNTVIGSINYNNFAAIAANGVVSVGSANSERRIQNVAAGEISQTSSDGINGSQLYSVAENVSLNRDMATKNKNDITEAKAKIDENKNALTTANNLISKNTANIASNTTDLVNVKAETSKNTNDLVTANSAISKNTDTIAQYASALGTTNADVAENTGALIKANAAIAKNTNDLVTANKAIVSNTNTIAENKGKLIILESEVSKNTAGLANANIEISKNTAGLANANIEISKNTADILKISEDSTTANSKINENSDKISKNTADILKISEDSTTANSKIKENSDKISKNTADLVKANTIIAQNSNDIANNRKDLDVADLAITKNTADLVTANTAIAKNTADLANTDANVASLGSAIDQNTTKISKGITFSDGKNSNTHQLGDTIAIKSTNQNLSVQTTNEGIKVGLNNNIKVDSIQINNGPSLSSNGIDAARTRISNVGRGVHYNDAVNVQQLSEVYDYTQKGDEIAYKGIAMSAALSNGSDAVARPGQLSGMVGVGNFKSNTAVALGITYLSKESNYKLTGGFAYAGSDDILYQGGIAFAIGR